MRKSSKKCKNLKIITHSTEEEIKINSKIVKIVPVWKEMLNYK